MLPKRGMAFAICQSFLMGTTMRGFPGGTTRIIMRCTGWSEQHIGANNDAVGLAALVRWFTAAVEQGGVDAREHVLSVPVADDRSLGMAPAGATAAAAAAAAERPHGFRSSSRLDAKIFFASVRNILSDGSHLPLPRARP